MPVEIGESVMRSEKLPAFQLYPADWRIDIGVQALPFEDRGIWFEILCLMYESEDRGKLTLAGKPMSNEALAIILGIDQQNLEKTITKLLEYGVASRSKDGALQPSQRNYINRVRPSIPINERRAVLAAGKCVYCGETEDLTVDHIVPYSRGGEHSIENYQCLCFDCNRLKSNYTEAEYFERLNNGR